MLKNVICILFLIGCIVGFVFDLIWTINSSNAWMGFFSMVLYAVGVYVSLQALARKK